MKKFLMTLSLLSSLVVFAGEKVTVYSSRHYADVDKVLFDEFKKETGIEVVEVNNKNAMPLIERIKKEDTKTDADVLLTVGIGDLYQAKKAGILDRITDKAILENIPSNLRDSDNKWVSLTYRARVMVYNPEKVSKDELSTYEDLVNPKWEKRIVTRSSQSAYNQNLIAFLVAKNGYDNTLEWAKGLVKNFSRDPKGNDRAQAAYVMQKKADIAIMNTYYMGKMLTDTDPIKVEAAHKLKIFFPNQKDGGAHINISGAGIVKNSKNKENALKFVKFLVSEKAQHILADKNFEYPANKNVLPNEVVRSWGDFIASDIPFDKIGENLENATRIAGDANWK
ncbi:extracellular solute-binding protein [Oceanivirga miroungae]|uniref:Iron(III) ABC transporter, periplasmic binding protein n=1 Tax=Oceanivirga miroungae TaxID=1130046 RepID=A0A6I8MCD5_9FUSO|nr:extracellular solute-binding protein [Oceanivirga miroungae]VWL85902.1 iron(III) ABC transporter, periplasmic binding protein [Oceanivirga miroungae]